MSKNLMDTDIGGENTQYEGEHTHVEPHDKQAGQLGNPSTGTKLADQVHKSASSDPNTQGVTSAEKMRYGQSIQEGAGGGGKTDATGQASSEGGFGGTERLNESGDGAAQQRRQQGYGDEKDMDRTIGA